MRRPKIKVYLDGSDSSQPWRWRLTAANGEKFASGEGYATRSNAHRAAKRLKFLAMVASIEVEG